MNNRERRTTRGEHEQHGMRQSGRRVESAPNGTAHSAAGGRKKEDSNFVWGLKRFCRRHRGLVVLGIVLAVILCLVLVFTAVWKSIVMQR